MFSAETSTSALSLLHPIRAARAAFSSSRISNAPAISSSNISYSAQKFFSCLVRDSIDTIIHLNAGRFKLGSHKALASWNLMRFDMPTPLHKNLKPDACSLIPPFGKRSLEPSYTVQDLVDLGDHVLGERHPGCGGVVVDLLGPGGADDRAAHVLLAQHPRERELRHAQARIRGDGVQPVHTRENLLVHKLLHKPAGLRVGRAGALLGGLAGAVFAGKDALGERGEDDLANALALAEGHDLALYLALDHVVTRLVGDDAIQVHLPGYPERIGDLVRRPLRDADI